jgi:sugar lactone lactonase YvrE
MKTYSRCITIAIINILVLTSCHKKDTPVPVTLTLSADKTSITGSSSAGKDSVQITSNTAWSISNIPSWVTVTPSSGNGNTKVYFNYTANTDTSSRSATLSFKATGVNDFNIKINQAAFNPTLTTDKTSMTELSSAGKDSVQITSNTAWSISNIPSWVTVTPSSGNGNTKVYFNYTANTTSSRSATLTLKATGVNDINIQITQNSNAVISTYTTHAAGGASITISGTGFSSTASQNIVTINGIAATVSNATTTSLTVTVPAKVGSGQIQLSVNGQAAITAGSFTYDWVAIVTTLAGNGNVGSTDGVGANATFTWPNGLKVDANGNIYVADMNSNKIRKITPAGVVTTFAGSGIPGPADGTGTNAQFYNPTEIVIDANGNLFVADSWSNAIRKITPAGVVTTFAGSGAAGNVDGTGTLAQFYNPVGIAIDQNGNLFVTDNGNNEIRKITPSGVVTTIAGTVVPGNVDGTGTSALFNRPGGITIDANSNLFVADSWNNEIRKITPAGIVTTVAGNAIHGSTDGTGTNAQFYFPQGITTDANGNIYVADLSNNEIRKITPAGVVTTFAGTGTRGSSDGLATAALFDDPTGVAVDANGNVYVADAGNNMIRKISFQ